MKEYYYVRLRPPFLGFEVAEQSSKEVVQLSLKLQASHATPIRLTVRGSLGAANDLIDWVLPPLSNSWIIFII